MKRIHARWASWSILVALAFGWLAPLGGQSTMASTRTVSGLWMAICTASGMQLVAWTDNATEQPDSDLTPRHSQSCLLCSTGIDSLGTTTAKASPPEATSAHLKSGRAATDEALVRLWWTSFSPRAPPSTTGA